MGESVKPDTISTIEVRKTTEETAEQSRHEC